ncbi:hypothetical protein ACF0H5_008039 [Mactra antiquata]
MAECVEHSQLCDTCCRDDKPIIRYCKICIQRLCKDCAGVHARGRLTASHSLLDIEGKSFSNKLLDYIWESYECPNHTGRTVEYICKYHDDVCCSECAIATHTHCEGLSRLSEECANSRDKSSTLNALNEFDEQTEILLLNEEANLKVLCKSKQNIEKEFNVIEINFLNAIKDLKQRVMQDLSAKHKILSDESLLSSHNITELNAELASVENKSHDIVDKEDPILCYLYDRQHRRDKTLSKFRSDLSDVADKVKHRDIKLINIKSVEDIYADCAVCACVWINESVVLACNVKNELIMLDPVKQSILHTKKCEPHPSSIVAVDKMNIAVCYDTNVVDILKIRDQQLEHETTIKLTLKVLAASMDESNSRLVCLSPSTGQIAFVPLVKSLDGTQSVVRAAHIELDGSYDIDYDGKVNKIFVVNHGQGKVISLMCMAKG